MTLKHCVRKQKLSRKRSGLVNLTIYFDVCKEKAFDVGETIFMPDSEQVWLIGEIPWQPILMKPLSVELMDLPGETWVDSAERKWNEFCADAGIENNGILHIEIPQDRVVILSDGYITKFEQRLLDKGAIAI